MEIFKKNLQKRVTSRRTV